MSAAALSTEPSPGRFRPIVRPAAGLATVVAALVLAVSLAAPGAADLGAPTSTAAVSGALGGSGTGLITAIRVGRHRAYDRVVIDFARRPDTAFTLRYVDSIAGPSNRPESLAGSAILDLTLRPANAHDPDTGRSAVPRELRPNFPTLRQVKIVEDFEAVVRIGLGLRSQVGFRAFVNGASLIVDVATGAPAAPAAPAGAAGGAAFPATPATPASPGAGNATLHRLTAVSAALLGPVRHSL